MRPSLRQISALVCVAMFAMALSTPTDAATLSTYPNEASFLAAISPGYTRVDFDGLAAGTLVSSQFAGVLFSSPNSVLAGAVPLRTLASSGALSAPNVLAGGYLPGSPNVPQTMVLDFTPGVMDVAMSVSPLAPNSNNVSVRLDFADGSAQTLQVGRSGGNGASFVGLRSDTRITRVTLVSEKGGGGQDGFRQFGLDNLIFSGADTHPPICSAEKVIEAGILGFNGTSDDSGPSDSGVLRITLLEASNVTLICDSPAPSGCGTLAAPVATATWRIAPVSSETDGHGVVLTEDAAGNICRFEATFLAFPGGSVDRLLVCSDTGLVLLVTNAAAALPGPLVCASNPPGPDDPPYPPGYEQSPEEDPSKCTVFTIKSTITGLTRMDLKKDGVFEPRLRLLFSRFDGSEFPPFTDITESVEEIDTIIPDPTRADGKGTWSQVKVACAIQSELCNGLDDDGDGQVDEGLPVGQAALDCDGDGYPLCPTGSTTALNCAGEIVPLIPGAPADCNDQIASIHGGAAESCNGLDDDCDGAADEGAPEGGAACVVAEQTGLCAAGVTSCAEGPLDCVQVTFPVAEICDGFDNDCDGASDEGHPGGGASCVLPDLAGPCSAGVISCAEGPAACAQVVFPSAETCDGIDNDCDGATDEGLGTLSCGIGACLRTVNSCDGGTPEACVPGTPGVETCNGVDDDCDGVVDEAYVFSGYLQPVNNDGSSIFQQRSTIPLKFRLQSCLGQPVTSAVATLEVLPYASQILGTELESGYIGKASTGNLFIYDSKATHYQYNLGTKTLAPNATYIIRTRLDDGTTRDVLISLK